MSRLFPAFLNLEGLPVLVAGAGAVALRKVRLLLETGARLTVIAPEACADMIELAQAGSLRWEQRGVREEDLVGQRLVFAATDNEPLNAALVAWAKAAGIFVNAATQPEHGSLNVPSHFKRGPLEIALSTQGGAPALARTLRLELEAWVDDAWGHYAELLKTKRAEILDRVGDPVRRRTLLQALGDRAMVDLLRREGRDAAEDAVEAAIRQVEQACGA